MEHEDMKAAVKALAATKKVNRTIKLSPEHDAYLQDYNASDLIGLLLDRFITEKEASAKMHNIAGDHDGA